MTSEGLSENEWRSASRTHVDNRHPTHDLESAIEVARVLQEQAGGNWTLEELVMHLTMNAPIGGAQLSRTTAARFFNLMESDGCNIVTTRLARRILNPESPQDIEDARAEAFLSVPLYRVVYERLASRSEELSSQEAITNVLAADYGIPQHQAELVCKVMLDSAKQAGLLASEKPLTFKAVGSSIRG